MIAVHDVFIHLSTACNVIGFDGKHFLQGVSGTICLQRPDFQLTKSLTTKLCLTTQRLLSNQAVGAS